MIPTPEPNRASIRWTVIALLALIGAIAAVALVVFPSQKQALEQVSRPPR